MESCKEMGGVRKSSRDMKKKGRQRTDESEPTIPKFFKFMVSDFKTQLRIPEKFVRIFGEELPQMISLRGQNGSTWRVCVRRSKEEVLLCCGWNRFVEDHQVQETDFLVFQYAGDATFSVEIYETVSGCEREACLDDVCIDLQKEDVGGRRRRKVANADGRHGAGAQSGGKCSNCQ